MCALEGKYLYMASNGCRQCAANTYSGAGASSCTSCPSGKVSSAGSTAQSDCYYAPCSAGNYMTINGCRQCAANTYSGAGASFCTRCPSGKVSAAGSTAQSGCYYAPCSAGNYMASNGCRQCAANTYSGAGASSCTSCPSGKMSAAGSTAQSDCHYGINLRCILKNKMNFIFLKVRSSIHIILWKDVLNKVHLFFPVGKTKFYLADLEMKNNGIYTPRPVVMSTTFFLNITYSGGATLGCGLTFNIVDEETMYHLDFRFNNKNMYKKLVQSKQVNRVWRQGEHSPENLELRTGENGIKVEIGNEFFKIWINGVEFSEDISVDPVRMSKYDRLSVIENGSCASFDLQSSFVEFPRAGEKKMNI